MDGDYAKSKAAATELVFDAAERGLNASIVLPSGIIGPGDLQGGSFTSMARSFLAGKLPLAVRGGYDFVDVRDVANGLLACSESGEPGKGYILSGCYLSLIHISHAGICPAAVWRIPAARHTPGKAPRPLSHARPGNTCLLYTSRCV